MNVSTALIEVMMKGKSKLSCSIVGLASGQSHEFQPVLFEFQACHRQSSTTGFQGNQSGDRDDIVTRFRECLTRGSGTN
jgi:hypothetical protein